MATSSSWKFYRRGYYEVKSEPYGVVLEPMPWSGPEEGKSIVEIKDPGAWVRGRSYDDLQMQTEEPKRPHRGKRFIS